MRIVDDGNNAQATNVWITRPRDDLDTRPLPRVLLIDDDPIAARLVSVILGSRGFDVEVAPNGRQGLTALDQFEPDAIILDINLPDMDGLDLCRAVRADCNTPIMIMSSNTALEIKERSIELGADDYATKPFSSLDLVERVRTLVVASERASRDELHIGGFHVDIDIESHRARVKAGKLLVVGLLLAVAALLLALI
ncbi:MAG: response regulator transcription factor [Acidimicrobiales bacterium]|nr:response regulator transcription factor [Acidimicrobiales bacterium]RZV46444.1 MAG: response regulator transcription factor [Acidimicrobiales bacterium]